MTEMLHRAVGEIEKLPLEEQDAIAARILAELAEDHAWTDRFRATTDRQWDLLADSVKREIADGQTLPLDAVFPPSVAQP